MRFLLLLLFLLPFLASCATPKPAPGAFDDAERRIQAAVDAGAEEYSPVELRFAREKLAQAHGRSDEEYNTAINPNYLIEQSEINAELAIEKSRAAEIRAKVTDLARQNEILREDFEATFGEGVQ